MSSYRLRDWLEIIGILAVVASLVFVGLEVRQSSEVAAEEAFAGDLANMIALDNMVVEHSEIWMRGCNGEDLSATDQVIFSRIYNSVQFTHFMRWARSHQGVKVINTTLTIDNMAMNLYRNPGLMDEWNRHWELRRQLTDESDLHTWRELVNRRVAEYRTFEPEPLSDVSRCGLN